MGTEVPKQFLPLNGKAIILHTIEKFKQALPLVELVLVLPEDEFERWKNMSKDGSFTTIRVAKGGENRFESVKSGLSLVPDDSVVAIHDGVRPFVSIETIQRVFKLAKEKNSAIPVVKLKDSIREIKAGFSRSVDRTNYRLVQTPQCFNTTLLKRAYEQDYRSSFTDDASVYEALGGKIHLVEGNSENVKITSFEDLKIAEAFAKIITMLLLLQKCFHQYK